MINKSGYVRKTESLTLCIVCNKKLTGQQRLVCSQACNQAKFRASRQTQGLSCKRCGKSLNTGEYCQGHYLRKIGYTQSEDHIQKRVDSRNRFILNNPELPSDWARKSHINRDKRTYNNQTRTLAAHTPEAKAKRSATMKEKFAIGEMNPNFPCFGGRFKTGYVDLLQGSCYHASGLEKRAFLWLDEKLGRKWKANNTTGKKSFTLIYVGENGKKKSYFPDAIAGQLLIEIRDLSQIHKREMNLKIKAAMEKGFVLKFLIESCSYSKNRNGEFVLLSPERATILFDQNKYQRIPLELSEL